MPVIAMHFTVFVVNISGINATVKVAETAKLVCKVHVCLLCNTTIVWKQNNSNIITHGGRYNTENDSLMIYNVTHDDEGDYVCVLHTTSVTIFLSG